jgi:hypothetical protein
VVALFVCVSDRETPNVGCNITLLFLTPPLLALAHAFQFRKEKSSPVQFFLLQPQLTLD